jgi:hypothetical protein
MGGFGLFGVVFKGRLPTDTDLNKVDVWFQDETRVGQQGSITRIWAEKGTRPRAVRRIAFVLCHPALSTITKACLSFAVA